MRVRALTFSSPLSLPLLFMSITHSGSLIVHPPRSLFFVAFVSTMPWNAARQVRSVRLPIDGSSSEQITTR